MLTKDIGQRLLNNCCISGSFLQKKNSNGKYITDIEVAMKNGCLVQMNNVCGSPHNAQTVSGNVVM